MKLDPDKLNNQKIKYTARASMAVIDALQDFPAEVQITALAAAFKLLADHLEVEAQDVMTVAGNILSQDDVVEFDAVAAYLDGQL